MRRIIAAQRRNSIHSVLLGLCSRLRLHKPVSIGVVIALSKMDYRSYRADDASNIELVRLRGEQHPRSHDSKPVVIEKKPIVLDRAKPRPPLDAQPIDKHAVEVKKSDASIDEMASKLAEVMGIAELKSQLDKVTRQSAKNEYKIAQLEAQLFCPPCKLTMTGYEFHKKAKDEWFSPPFYDRPGGYKFCLSVIINGSGDHCGAGSHISLYVYIMQGQNDAQLVWPFRGSIEIQLVNQKKQNKSVVVEFDKKAAASGRADRVMTEDTCTKDSGCGFSQFVSHHKLEKVSDRSQYILDDSLTFIIADIHVTVSS